MECAECQPPVAKDGPSAVALGSDEDVFHGYIGALRQPKPVFFEFLVTERCNMRCAYCWEKGERNWT